MVRNGSRAATVALTTHFCDTTTTVISGRFIPPIRIRPLRLCFWLRTARTILQVSALQPVSLFGTSKISMTPVRMERTQRLQNSPTNTPTSELPSNSAFAFLFSFFFFRGDYPIYPLQPGVSPTSAFALPKEILFCQPLPTQLPSTHPDQVPVKFHGEKLVGICVCRSMLCSKDPLQQTS